MIPSLQHIHARTLCATSLPAGRFCQPKKAECSAFPSSVGSSFKSFQLFQLKEKTYNDDDVLLKREISLAEAFILLMLFSAYSRFNSIFRVLIMPGREISYSGGGLGLIRYQRDTR